MKNKLISSEDDVRALVRMASGGSARWVEPALGSTPGLPDCWVPLHSACVHLELKLGTIKNNRLKYKLRPEQRREILALVDDGVKVGLLVGVKGTDEMFFMPAEPIFLHGELSLFDDGWMKRCYQVTLMKDHSFMAGVNFIFLSGSKYDS